LRGINFFAEGNDGKKIVPIICGKSAVGSALDEIGYWPANKDDLSDEVKAAESWLFKESDEEDAWLGSCVHQFDAQDLVAMDLSRKKRAGFVDKDTVLAYERGDVDWIEDVLTGREYADLPEDARIGYQYYEWSENREETEMLEVIRARLLERIEAFNELYLDDEKTSKPISITTADCRVIIIIS